MMAVVGLGFGLNKKLSFLFTTLFKAIRVKAGALSIRVLYMGALSVKVYRSGFQVHLYGNELLKQWGR